MDGPTTFKEMQAIPAIAHIPVILLTAKVQGVDQRRFAGLGVTAVLVQALRPTHPRRPDVHALGWSS